MSATISTCASCGAAIYWLRHERTKTAAPIDAEPSEDGDLLVDTECGLYRYLPPVERGYAKRKLHVSHFATCPQAKDWRGVRR